jgi:hypothetical protein
MGIPMLVMDTTAPRWAFRNPPIPWAPIDPLLSTDQTTRFSSWLSRNFTSLKPSPGAPPV